MWHAIRDSALLCHVGFPGVCGLTALQHFSISYFKLLTRLRCFTIDYRADTVWCLWTQRDPEWSVPSVGLTVIKALPDVARIVCALFLFLLLIQKSWVLLLESPHKVPRPGILQSTRRKFRGCFYLPSTIAALCLPSYYSEEIAAEEDGIGVLWLWSCVLQERSCGVLKPSQKVQSHLSDGDESSSGWRLEDVLACVQFDKSATCWQVALLHRGDGEYVPEGDNETRILV